MRIPYVSPVLIIVVAALWAVSCGAPPAAPVSDANEPVTLTVFAAASLTDILTITGGTWQDESGNTLQFNFASSGTLARQLIEGAPADLFISANRDWMDLVVENGLADAGDVVPFCSNRLVVIAAADSTVELADLSEITRHVTDGIAIGDPAHVPAGQYAQEALTACGAWPILERGAVRAVDVRAALAYVERKETELGIVFATDVFGNRNVKVLLEIPAELHTPAHYYCAPLRQGQREAALAWLQFMRAPEQATVMSAVGFLMPGK